ESVAAFGGSGLLPRGGHERQLAAFAIGNTGELEHAALEELESLAGGCGGSNDVRRAGVEIALASDHQRAFAPPRALLPCALPMGDGDDDVRGGDPRFPERDPALLDGICAGAQAGRIDEGHRDAVPGVLDLDVVARGAGLGCDEDSLASDERVDERRLAD